MMNAETLALALGLPARQLTKYSSQYLVRAPEGGMIPRVKLIEALRAKGLSDWRPLSEFDEVGLVEASRRGSLQEIQAMTDSGVMVSFYRSPGNLETAPATTAPPEALPEPAEPRMASTQKAKEPRLKQVTVVFAPGDNLRDPTMEEINTINWGSKLPVDVPSNGTHSTHINGMPVAGMSEADLRGYGFTPQREWEIQHSMTSGFYTGIFQRVRIGKAYWYRFSPLGYQRRGYYTEEFLAQHGYSTVGLDRMDTHFGVTLWLCLELLDHLRYTYMRSPRGKAVADVRAGILSMRGPQGPDKPESVGFRRIDALLRKKMIDVSDLEQALAFYRGPA